MIEQCVQTVDSWDELAHERDEANLRALKAEKAFLNLRMEIFEEKNDLELKQFEQQCLAKMNLYGPEHIQFVQDEFQKRSSLTNTRLERAKKVHKLCLEALEKGLTMDELPLSNADLISSQNLDVYQVEQFIRYQLQQKLTAKIQKAMQQNKDQHFQQGISRNGSTTNGIQSPVLHGGFSTTPISSNYSMGVQPLNPPGNAYHGQPVQPQYNFGVNRQFIEGAQAQQPQPVVKLNQQRNTVSPKIPDVNVSQQQTASPSVAATQSKPSLALDMSQRRPHSMNTRSEPSMHSPVGDLDDFMIDDDMFKPPLPDDKRQGPQQVDKQQDKATIDNTNKAGDVRFTVACDDFNDDESDKGDESDDHSDDSSLSVEDEQEFALKLARRQGAKVNDIKPDMKPKVKEETKPKKQSKQKSSSQKQSNQPNGQEANSKQTDDSVHHLHQPKAPPNKIAKSESEQAVAPPEMKPVSTPAAEAKKENAAAMCGKAESVDETNWKEEPFASIVMQLAQAHKISNKVAEGNLAAAARKLGGIDELDKVWAEAERSIKQALRPMPLQPSQSAPNIQQNKPKPSTSSSAVSANKSEGGRFSNFKTALCANWLKDKRCPLGEYCTFAHGKGDLRATPNNKPSGASADNTPAPNTFYKVILCRNFEANNMCTWGSNCIFAHGQEELRRPGDSLNIVNQDQANDTVHTEPCDNQQCPGKLEYLLRKTSLCDKNRVGTCRFGKDCKFAHSKKELKGMPKWEMCVKYEKGKCMHSRTPEKCVYAHSQKELKKKPAELENRPVQTASSGGRLIQPGRKYIPWAGDDKHPPSQDGEECHICMGPLTSKKNLLKCGHNNFHERCISQWVNEGMPSCPICREPAKLPDLFKAPAGFKPEEFPGLGL